MKKILIAAMFFSIIIFSRSVFSADTQTQNNSAAYEQAKQDYRVYLEQLKALNQQYKDVTRQVAQIVKEEGLPTWDAGTEGLDLGDKVNDPKGGAFGGADIEDAQDYVTVKVDLPGVQKDKIQVNIRDNKFLDIKAERREQKSQVSETAGTSLYKSERHHGTFERTIELPVLVNDTGTQAKYENGVLQVVIKKAPLTKKDVKVRVD